VLKILCVSDLHCGSLSGLMSNKFYDEINREDLFQNEVQAFLFDNWVRMCKDVGRVDKVVVCGDLVDGLNKAEHGKGQSTTDMMTQCRMAVQLLKMIDTSEYIVVDGSPYHTGWEISGDLVACDMLGGTWGDVDIDVTFENVTFHVRHHESWSKDPAGRHTSARKEANVATLQNEDIDVFLRGHTHSFNFNGDKRNITVVTPCWKGPDRFMRKKNIEIPDCGYIVFNIEGIDYNWEQTVFNVPKQLFRKHLIFS